MNQVWMTFGADGWERKLDLEVAQALGLPDAQEVPPYSTSLDACAQAEAQIKALGLHQPYGAYLSQLIQEFTGIRHLLDLPWAIATADPAIRCRAILETVRQRR